MSLRSPLRLCSRADSALGRLCLAAVAVLATVGIGGLGSVRGATLVTAAPAGRAVMTTAEGSDAVATMAPSTFVKTTVFATRNAWSSAATGSLTQTGGSGGTFIFGEIGRGQIYAQRAAPGMGSQVVNPTAPAPTTQSTLVLEFSLAPGEALGFDFSISYYLGYEQGNNGDAEFRWSLENVTSMTTLDSFVNGDSIDGSGLGPAPTGVPTADGDPGGPSSDVTRQTTTGSFALENLTMVPETYRFTMGAYAVRTNLSPNQRLTAGWDTAGTWFAIVVPEPSRALLLGAGFAMSFVSLTRRRRVRPATSV